MKILQAKMLPSEYIHRPDLPVPMEVHDKIVLYHSNPMNFLRHEMNAPIFVSDASGYRPEIHEKENGRNGLSTHTFTERPERQDPGRGAADYWVHVINWYKFINLMIEAPYNRLILYPEMDVPFVHGDYRYIGVTKFYYIVKGTDLISVDPDELVLFVEQNISKGL